jgi:hypothetical protein
VKVWLRHAKVGPEAPAPESFRCRKPARPLPCAIFSQAAVFGNPACSSSHTTAADLEPPMHAAQPNANRLGTRMRGHLTQAGTCSKLAKVPQPDDNSVPDGYTSRRDALKSFSKVFLIAYSASGTRNRLKPILPHPALTRTDGMPRAIETVRYHNTINGRRCPPAVASKTTDLAAVLQYKIPDGWVNRKQVRKLYPRLFNARIEEAEAAGLLHPEWFPWPPTRSLRLRVKHWNRDELAGLMKRRET